MKSWLINRLRYVGKMFDNFLGYQEQDDRSALAAWAADLELARKQDAERIERLEQKLDRTEQTLRGARRNESLIATRVGRLQREMPDVHNAFFLSDSDKRR